MPAESFSRRLRPARNRGAAILCYLLPALSSLFPSAAREVLLAADLTEEELPGPPMQGEEAEPKMSVWDLPILQIALL